jgi:xyloglucan-specific exo-beta-1,4-glucanase
LPKGSVLSQNKNLQIKKNHDMKNLYLAIVMCLFLNYTGFTQGNYKWGNVGIGGGGFVSAIITSKAQKDLMFARTDVGGAYRWDASAKSWIPLTDWASQDQTGFLGVESFAVDPQSPNKVYALVGISYFNGGKTAILRSSDYGNTFTTTEVTSQFKAHGNGMGRQNGERLIVDPNLGSVLYCGTRWNGLFKSTNSGASWSRLSGLNVTTTPNENGISFVVADPAGVNKGSESKIIYAGISRTGENLYVSKDGGKTFTAVTGGPTNYMPQRAVLSSDGMLYITYGNGAGPHAHWSLPEPMEAGAIYKYNTSNNTWTNITPSGYTRAFSGISIDPTNPARLVATTINTYMPQASGWGDRIFLSTNGGTSWKDLFANGVTLDPNGCTWVAGHVIHWAGSVEFDQTDPKKVWVTSGNGIFMTEDVNASKTTWKFMVKGLEETVPLDMVSIPGGPSVSVIGDYDGFRHSDIYGYSPIHNPQMGTSTGIAYAGKKKSVVVRVGNKMYYSLDTAKTWTQCTSKGAKGKVAVSADGSVFLHCPEKTSTTFWSDNKGSSWTQCSGLSVSDAFPVADPVNPAKFYVFNRSTGETFVSTDAGKSFKAAANAGSAGACLKAVPDREGELWIPLWNGLARSSNSGQSFTKINGVWNCGAVGFGKAQAGKTYPTVFIWGNVNGVTGIFQSTDQGASWTRINDDEHEYGGPGNGEFIVGDMNVEGRVYMSTAGRGIIYGEADPVITAAEDAQYFAGISSVFPNPFTDGIIISDPSAGSYKIYSQKGELVETGLCSDDKPAGRSLAPGVYFIQLQYEETVKTIRVVKI